MIGYYLLPIILLLSSPAWAAEISGGGSSGSSTLDQVTALGNSSTGNTEANPFEIFGSGAYNTTGWQIGTTSGGVPFLDCYISSILRNCDRKFQMYTAKTFSVANNSGDNAIAIKPDAASANLMYQFGPASNSKPLLSIYVPLTPRGAATMTETNILANQPKAWWGTLTDADTDAFDFHFPITKKMEGATTATVRLWGVSDNGTPSGNIQLHCAMKSYRPGTDTYEAHQTTGEQSVTLTPATTNRPVSAVSSAITINGTVAEFGEMIGSCEVSASGTTSAQLTDFFLRGDALIQLSVNSLSD